MSKMALKLSTLLTLASGLFLSAISPIYAADPIGTPAPALAPTTPLTNDTLTKLNPLNQFGTPDVTAQLSTPGGIVSRLLFFAFPVAGLILFVMIVWGGFEILSGATDKKSMDTGKNRVTAAIVGFILLFSVYWIAQIIQVVFGLKFL